MAANDGLLILEDAELLPFPWMNFAGRPTKFNKEGGKREFSVYLDENVAEQMLADGWNVKRTKPYGDEGDDQEGGRPYITVNVNFRFRPPTIVINSSRQRIKLPIPDDEQDLVQLIDDLDIAVVDLIIRPRKHDFAGGGIKGYLKTMFVTIQEDYLEMKYSDRPYTEITGHEGLPLAITAGGEPEVEESYDDDDVIEGEIVD